MSRTWKRFLSLLLVATMVLSLGVTGFAADEDEPAEEPVEEAAGGVEVEFEQVDNDIIASRLPLANEIKEEAEPEYAEDEVVRVSIVLDGPSALEAGYAPASASSYRANLKAEQDALANQISAQALGGAQLNVVWNLTLAANIISAWVEYGQIEDIKNVIGVKDVVIENMYYPAEDEINNSSATQMTGTTGPWDLGYTGAGSKIAIVDTGLDITHQSFDSNAYKYAIENLGKDVDVMSVNDVEAVWEDLNASAWVDSASDAYFGAKVPFGVNYVDKSLDITHVNDTQGEHGSHVAGIAAANKFIPNGDGTYSSALETVYTQGQAPDAQLLIMKVFGQGGGAADSDYFAAIEDALVLGCDSVNLSLGSGSPGFVENSVYAETLQRLLDADVGLVWANSAGNSGAWNDSALGQYGVGIYEDDINYHTGGSPATYHNTLSVASVDNTGVTGMPLIAGDGSWIFFNETGGYSNAPIKSIAGDYEYVLLVSPGVADNDYSGNDFAALGEDIIAGKIAICQRGSSSFFAKANAAAEQGAAAVIIFNNTSGTINMNLSGYEYEIPVVSITQADGFKLASIAEEKEANGITYYEGTLTITDTVKSMNNETEYLTMSSFSSWGGNGALTMKPEITAPGGNIYSIFGTSNDSNGNPQGGSDLYELMSGTSMASPQIAGINAALKQYIRETGLAGVNGLSERGLAQSLLMSTAVPIKDANSYGGYYSILKQGAGLANLENAINARSVVKVTNLPDSAPASAWSAIDDGKVKMELGEVYNGFDGAFQLTNISDEDISFYLNGEFFTQEVADGFRWEETVPVYASLYWAVNGEPYAPVSLAYDFNGDGVSNGLDAQFLLDACAKGTADEIANADLNEDGAVNTADAKLAFEKLNGVALTLAAGETITIAVTAEYDMSEYDEVNGNYVEGFLFVQEGATGDGALGTLHSIPVYGFNGSITDATMFDRGSRLEYGYEFGDGELVYPYMYYADSKKGGLGEDSLSVETFLVKYQGDSNKYALGGNPFGWDDEYFPERNAIKAADQVAGVQFTALRNSAASRFIASYQNGIELPDSEIVGGAAFGAYFHVNNDQWYNTSRAVGLGWAAGDLKEGSKLVLNFSLAPEYYVDYTEGSVAWDELGEGASISLPIVIDNTAPDIVKVEHVVTSGVPLDDYEGDIAGNESEDKIEITVHDNQFVAAVGLYTEDGEELGWTLGAQDTIRGKENVYSFDISGNTNPHLLVQVYDYACNLATFKLNFNEEELEGEVSVQITPESLRLLRGNTAKLTADVYPWGVDGEVIWTSEDPTIASVNDNGIVTGVSVGTTTITATSMKDPNATATAEVEIFTIPATLIGILQDESGTPLLFAFDVENEKTWQPMAEMEHDVTAATLDWLSTGLIYQQDFSGYMHAIDPETLETVESSAAPTAFGAPMEDFDMGYVYNNNTGSNRAYAVAESRLLYSVDVMDNTFSRGYDLSDFLATYTGAGQFVAICWAGPSSNRGDEFLALDDAGYIWVLDTNRTGGLTNLGYVETGLKIDYPFVDATTGNSLMLGDDGELYLAHFTGGTSEFYQLPYNAEEGIFDALYLGDAGDDVWPAALLTVAVNEAEAPDDDDSLPVSPITPDMVTYVATFTEDDEIDFNDPADYVDEPETIEEPVIEEITEPAEIEEPVETTEPAGDGSLNAVRGLVDTQKTKTDVIVDIVADEDTTNGKITIDFDPTTATLISAVPGTGIQFKSVIDESADLGHYVLAYVALDPVAADESLLTLTFAYGSEGTVTINNNEINDKTGPEEIVILGSTIIPEDHEHVFGEPKWTWNEDYSSAVATFLCEDCGAARSVRAEIEEEIVKASCEEDGSATYTATVEFEGETYTDVKTVELPATGHEFGEPVWTWADDLSTATATFKCAVCEKEFEVEATVERTVDDVVTYTATAEFEDETYTDVKTVAIQARVYGNNLNMDERFTLNALIDLSEDVLADEDAYVTISKEFIEGDKAEVSVTIPVSEAPVYKNNIRKFALDIIPAWFNDEITLKLFDGEGNEIAILAKDGSAMPNGFIYSGQEYVNRGLAPDAPVSAAWKEAFKAVNDLGRYAQVYFKHNTGKLAEVQITDLSGITAETLAAYAPTSTKLDGTSVEMYGTSMVLETGFILRCYFKLGDEKIEDLTFTVDGEEVEAVQKGEYVYLATDNLPAKKLGEAHTFAVLKGEDTLVSTSASAYSYVLSIIAGGYTGDVLNLVKGLYLYGENTKAALG